MTIAVEKLCRRFDTFIPPLIDACLPDQGSIEIQHDRKDKEHAWHTHPTDETIVVLEGQLKFYWEGGERVCGPGDVIQLPRETRHGSVALEASRYIITFATVDIGSGQEA
jgi:ethanolamine utilization protein EutQ (cupin superfamily)